MWTAILESASNADKVWAYTIVYTDGQQKFRREYRGDVISDALIESVARAEIARLTSVSDGGKLSYQPGAQISLVVAPTADPTPEQLARNEFLSNYRKLDQLLRASSKKLIPADDARIAELQKTLQDSWLDSYVGLV